MSIELIKQPNEGVRMRHADGAYWRLDGDVAQIIVVGPMQGSPLDYELALRYFLNEDWVIGSAEFMLSSNKSNKSENYIALRRGIVNLMFRKRPITEDIGPDVDWISSEDAKAKMVT